MVHSRRRESGSQISQMDTDKEEITRLWDYEIMGLEMVVAFCHPENPENPCLNL
jgi:hypothetical protein